MILSKYFQSVPSEQKEKLKEFRRTKEFKKVRIVVIICAVLALLFTFYILLFNVEQKELIIVVVPVFVLIFMTYYGSKLKQFSKETAEYAEKLEDARESGMKRGKIIGLILGLIFIIYLVILMPTIQGKLIVGVGSLIFGLIFYYKRK